eukprot:scaffold49592_cov27-Tisochrysis_lutea.AAC.1
MDDHSSPSLLLPTLYSHQSAHRTRLTLLLATFLSPQHHSWAVYLSGYPTKALSTFVAQVWGQTKHFIRLA